MQLIDGLQKLREDGVTFLRKRGMHLPAQSSLTQMQPREVVDAFSKNPQAEVYVQVSEKGTPYALQGLSDVQTLQSVHNVCQAWDRLPELDSDPLRALRDMVTLVDATTPPNLVTALNYLTDDLRPATGNDQQYRELKSAYLDILGLVRDPQKALNTSIILEAGRFPDESRGDAFKRLERLAALLAGGPNDATRVYSAIGQAARDVQPPLSSQTATQLFLEAYTLNRDVKSAIEVVRAGKNGLSGTSTAVMPQDDGSIDVGGVNLTP